MKIIEFLGFPDPNHDCFESSLICILQHLIGVEELSLMTKHNYLVFNFINKSVFPRANSIVSSWESLHGLKLETHEILDKKAFVEVTNFKLDANTPICVPVDIYYLPHTSHYNQIHIVHYLNVFGFNEKEYYIVSPYYKYAGWVEKKVLHDAFFSAHNKKSCIYYFSQIEWRDASQEQKTKILIESCEYMLGLKYPIDINAARQESIQVGLIGITSLSSLLRDENILSDKKNFNENLELSSQLLSMGYSRYWLRESILNNKYVKLPPKRIGELTSFLFEIERLWRAAGTRFGGAIYSGNLNMVLQSKKRVDEIHKLEHDFYKELLSELSVFERGSL